MRTVTLKVQIGRAVAQPLASFDYSNPTAAERACEALELRKLGELITSGHAPERISFTKEYRDGEKVSDTPWKAK